MKQQYKIIELRQLWERILEGVKEDFDAKVYDSMLLDSYLSRIDGTKLVVVVNSSTAAKLLNENYSDFINGVVRSKTQSDYVVEFIDKEHEEIDVAVEEKNSVFFKSSFINQQLNFDNFVVGESNREASQAALVIAANPGRTYNPLFIYSDSGLGKTHLLHAIGNYIKTNNPSKKVLYLPAEDFFDEYVNYVKGKESSEDLVSFFKREVDVLLLDDVQLLANKKNTLVIFFNVFSSMLNAGKQVVVASDKSPNELEGFEARLITRFNAGLTVNIKALDLETSKNILRRISGEQVHSPLELRSWSSIVSVSCSVSVSHFLSSIS